MSRSISRKYADKLGTPIDASIHQRGYDLLRSGLQEKRCRAQLGLTATQWRWLRTEGNSQFPSYESMMIEEVSDIRTQARNAAKQLSKEGVETMRLRVENARAANAITSIVLMTAVEGMREEIREKRFDAVLGHLPGKGVTDALKVLQKIGELGPTADAFVKIFGDVAAHKGLYPERDRPRSDAESGQPLELLQGDQADRDDFMNEETVTDILDDLRGMTEDELRRFVEDGDEVVVDRSSAPEA